MNSTHPSAELLTRFGGGDLSATDLLAVDDHVASCEECRSSLQATFLGEATDRWQQLLQEQNRQPRERRWMAVALPVAAAAAAVVVLLLLSRDSESPLQSRVTSPPRSATQPVAPKAADVIRDGERTYIVAGRRVNGLPPDLQAVADRILDGSLPSRDAVRLLNPPPGLARGEERPDHSIRLTTPVGTVVEEDRPSFVWSHPEGTEWSRVEVFDTTLRRVAASERGTAEQWRPTEPLPRGATYLWQVRASRRGTVITAPAPPLPPARFMIIGADAAKQIQDARGSGSRLVLALLYAREGKLDAARAELEALASSNPETELPRALAGALR